MDTSSVIAASPDTNFGIIKIATSRNIREIPLQSVLVWILAIGSILILLFAGYYYLRSNRVAEFERGSVIAQSDTIEAVAESAVLRDGQVHIGGYAFYREQSIRFWNLTVVLENTSTNDWVSIPTQLSRKPDFRDSFHDASGNALNLELAGFSARVPVTALDPGATYRILVYYQNDGLDLLASTGAALDGDFRLVELVE